VIVAVVVVVVAVVVVVVMEVGRSRAATKATNF